MLHNACHLRQFFISLIWPSFQLPPQTTYKSFPVDGLILNSTRKMFQTVSDNVCTIGESLTVALLVGTDLHTHLVAVDTRLSIVLLTPDSLITQISYHSNH